MSLNLSSLLLILNSLIYLSNQVDFGNLQPFYCEDVNKYDNYFNKENKFIFVIKENYIRWIFNDRQFAFKAPYFGDNEQSDDLIFGNPFLSQEFNNSFAVDHKFIGTINKNDVIYLPLIDFESVKDCYKLYEDAGMIMADSFVKCDELTEVLSIISKIDGFIHYFQKNNSTFLLNYKNDKKLQIIRINDLSKKTIDYVDKYTIDYEIKAAAIGYFQVQDDLRIQHLNLYEIDENFQFHISLIEIEVDINDTIIQFTPEKKTFSLSRFNFINVIGCFNKITELNQIKGILFKDNKFYIISYGKYWIYESNLIKERFNLNDKNSSPYYIQFINKDDLLTVEYEIRSSKWIKQLDDEIYFMPYKNSIFNIQFQNDYQNSKNSLILQFKKSEKESLNYCKGSTIRFNDDDYCFESTKYFKTKLFDDNNNKDNFTGIKYPISDLFTNTPYNFTNDDELLFIFKYTDNSTIFLTIKSIIIIDFKLFSELQDYLQLKSPLDDSEFFFDENCLLRKCVSSPKSRNNTVYHDHPHYNIDHYHPNIPTSIVWIIFIILFISVIYLIRKKISKNFKNIFAVCFNRKKRNYSENEEINQSQINKSLNAIKNSIDNISKSFEKIGKSKISKSQDKISKSQDKISKSQSPIDKSQSGTGKSKNKIVKSKDKISKSQSSIGKSQTRIGESKDKISKSQSPIDKSQSGTGKSKDKIKR